MPFSPGLRISATDLFKFIPNQKIVHNLLNNKPNCKKTTNSSFTIKLSLSFYSDGVQKLYCQSGSYS